MLNLHWVTWWPVPYWTDRFNYLGECKEIEFKAVFLFASAIYYEWKLDPTTWKFRYKILSHRPSASGFYKQSYGIKNPLPLLRGDRDVSLVMPYADPTYVAAAMIAKVKRIPYYLFVANTIYDSRSGNTVKERLKRLMFTGASGCLATGPLQREYAHHYAGPKKPVAVIGNPIDTGRLRLHAQKLLPQRRDLRRGRGWEGRFVVAYVGRLAPEKDIPTLFYAAQRLSAHRYPITVTVVGSGPLELELRKVARELNIQVDFEGFLQDLQLSELYTCADVFVLPSLNEPWGLVVNEAMEFSLPIILSDRVGAQCLLSPGRNGFLFPAGNADELARVLLMLARDEKLRQTMGDASRATVENETIANWAQQVIDAVHTFQRSE